MQSKIWLRLSAAVILSMLLAVNAFAQYRGENPPTPSELQEQITGSQAKVTGLYKINGKDSYLPRKFFKQRTGGRRKTKFLDDEGNPIQLHDNIPGDMIINIDQYRLLFEFQTPRQLTVKEPDRTTKTYWYLIYKVVNIDEVPVNGHLNFSMLISPENLEATPEGTPNEKWQELLDRFAGNKEVRDKRGLTKFVDELKRGIKRSMLLNYVNYPDRFLMDLICEKENYWKWDKYGRRYNQLIPCNYMHWRKKLRIVDDYVYPDVIVYDVHTKEDYADAYIIKPIYKSGSSGEFNEDENTRIIVKFVPGGASGGSIEEKEIQKVIKKLLIN